MNIKFMTYNIKDGGIGRQQPPVPTIRLDYAFANQILLKGLQSCDVVREPAVANHASDHYPDIAEFML